ncbi:MAG TPA: hypothetical protein VLV78_17140 [Thermoanaerobaculia bacterium]|nr:hypothetical protein [Thermoanaerobaculia bacterium]
MKTHYSEADLLETYYMQPGDSMPVMMHLASCGDCAARYERLERKLREAAACPTERPETFWSRQRLSIMRRIASQPVRQRLRGVTGVAAAALLAFLSGAAIVYHETRPAKPAPAPANAVATAKATPTVDEMHAPINPWQSEELQRYHEVVQWESWVDTNGDGNSL